MESPKTNECPSPDRLRGLLSGELPAGDQDSVTRHIEACPSCQRTLDNWLSSPSVEGLAAAGKDSATQEAALRELMEQVKKKSVGAMTQAESEAANPDDLAYLKPSDKPGALGRLHHYDVLQILGKGGFGTVFKAFDTKLQRMIAIKVLAPELAANGSARKRFIREAQAAAAIKNEHVVAIYNVEDEHQPPYIVMEIIDGISLQDRVDQAGSLELKEILRIGMQIAEGLASAHKQGLIHRDIKPANILLENGVQRVKITDFGLARLTDDASISQSGLIAGTPMYMAPEQAQGEQLDQRADLFSLGSVLYTLSAGHPPFRANTTMAVLKRVCEETPRPIREINPELPDWLSDIITKLHAKQAKDRYQTARAVADLLGEKLAELQFTGRANAGRAEGRKAPFEAPAAESINRPLTRHGSPKRLLLAAATVGVLTLAAILLTVVYWPRNTDAPTPPEKKPPVVPIVADKDASFILTSDEYEWTEAQNLGREINSEGSEIYPWVSADGLTLLYMSARGGRPDRDIWQCTRSRVDEDWSRPIKLVEPISSGWFEGGAVMSADACTLVFVSARPEGGLGKTDLWMATREKADAPWRTPVNLGATINSPELDSDPLLSDDGLQLVFNSMRGGRFQIWVTKRKSVNDPWTSPELLPGITGKQGGRVQLLDSGRTLLYGFKGFGISFARWNAELSRWADDAALPPPIIGSQRKEIGFFHRATNTLYFESDRPGGQGDYDLWMSRRVKKSTPRPKDGWVQLFNGKDLTGWKKYGSKGNDAIVEDGSLILKGSCYYNSTSSFKDYTLRVDAKVNEVGAASIGVRNKPPTASIRLCPSGRHGKSGLLAVGKGMNDTKYYFKPDSNPTLPDTWFSVEITVRGNNVVVKINGQQTADAAIDGLLETGVIELGSMGNAAPGTIVHFRKIEIKELPPTSVAPQPFVVLAKAKRAETRHPTLAAAVAAAQSGDTIEIQGNGPFQTEPIVLGKKALTIRAGAGYRPHLKHQPTDPDSKQSLLATEAALVLEGLTLERGANPGSSKTMSPGTSIVHVGGGRAHFANCRFVGRRVHFGVSLADVTEGIVTNCEILGTSGSHSSCGVMPVVSSRVLLENNLVAGYRVGSSLIVGKKEFATFDDIALSLRHNTIRAGWYPLGVHTNALSNSPRLADPKAIRMRFEAAGNIFSGNLALHFGIVDKSPTLENASPLLLKMVAFKDDDNLYHLSLNDFLHAVREGEPAHDSLGNLQAWHRFWGITKSKSWEGVPVYTGGDVLAKTLADPAGVSPADFRLTNTSSGKGAGSGGKDLGADVDLVGPGEAYERWKKTPAYQEWRKQTEVLMNAK